VKVQVNGEDREVDPGLTVYRLLAGLGLDPELRGIAVALDGEVVFRRHWQELELQSGSRVEIVRAVAGG
jgi:sulfur carrier protein